MSNFTECLAGPVGSMSSKGSVTIASQLENLPDMLPRFSKAKGKSERNPEVRMGKGQTSQPSRLK